MDPHYNYHEPVLAQLAKHGLRPTAATAPVFVREALADLYLYEIRCLRICLRSGAFPKPEYASRAEALRSAYPLLSLPVKLWTVET